MMIRYILFVLFIWHDGMWAFSWFKHDRAAYAAQQESWDTSKALLKELVRDNPDDPSLLYDAGVSSYKLGEIAQARGYFQQAASSSNANQNLKEQSFFNLGNTYMHDEQYKQAIEAYDQALAINSDNERAKHNKKIAEEKLRQQQQQQEQKQDQNKKDQQQDQNKEQNQDKNKDDQNKQDQNDQKQDQNKDQSDQSKQEQKQQPEQQSKEQQSQSQEKQQEQEQKQNNGSQGSDDKNQQKQGQEEQQQGNKSPEQKDSEGQKQESGAEQKKQEKQEEAKTGAEKKQEKKEGKQKGAQEEKSDDKGKQKAQAAAASEKDSEDQTFQHMKPQLARMLQAQESSDAQLQKQLIRAQVNNQMGARDGENCW